MTNFCSVFNCLSGKKLTHKLAERAWIRSQLVRIVVLHYPPLTLNSSRPGEDCEIGGALRFVYPLIPKHVGFNCTAYTATSSRQDKDGNYTGYIGRLQSDRADYSPALTHLPLPGIPVEYSPVVTSDKITFTTMYERPRRAISDSDLLASFRQIDIVSWVTFFLLVMITAFMLRCQKQKWPLFKVFQCFLPVYWLRRKDVFKSSSQLGSGSGFFVLALFYSNFMLSELVQEEHPSVLKSFFDVLKPEADIHFTDSFPVDLALKHSKSARVRLISDRVEHEGVEKLIVNGWRNAMGLYLKQPKVRLLAVFGGNNRMKHVKRFTCAMLLDYSIKRGRTANTKSLWVPQDSPLEILIATVYNKKLDKRVKKVLDLAIQRYMEHDLYGNIFYKRLADIFRDIIYGVATNKDRLCYADKILIGEPDNDYSINMKNTDLVFLTMGIAFAIAFYASRPGEDCKIGGALRFVYPLIAKYIGFNCTAYTATSSRQDKDGNYTGYIGRLQSDRADYSPTTAHLPLAGSPVDYSPVVTSDKITFTTMYERPQRAISDSDLLASFRQIDIVSWATFFLLVMITAFILRCQKQKWPLFKVFQCFFQYTGFEGKAFSSRLRSWTAVVGFFVLALFYSNFMLSELVQEEHPSVLKRFFDVLKPEAAIRFIDSYPVDLALKHSKSARVRLLSDRVEHEGVEKLTAKGLRNSMSLYLKQPKGRLLAVFGGHNRVKHAKRFTCAMLLDYSMKQGRTLNTKSLWVPQDSPLEFLIATPYSKKLDKGVKKVLDLAVQRYMEHDLYGNIFYKRLADIFRDIIYGVATKKDRLCYADKILIGEPDNDHSINMKNTDLVFLTMGLAFTIAFSYRLGNHESMHQRSKGTSRDRDRSILLESKNAMSERGNENNCQSSLLTFVKTQVKQNIEHVNKLSTLIEAINVVQSTSKPVKEVHSEGNKILKSVLAFLKSLEIKAESETTARSSPVVLEDLKTCMKDIIAEEIGKLQMAQQTPSYAAITQTRADMSHRNASVSVLKHIVRVRTKNKDWSTRELRDTLKENIELTEQVRIEQMRCGSDAVTIACDSLPAKEALITAIRSKADSLSLEVEDKQLVKKDPCIVVANIPTEIEDASILEAVKKSCPLGEKVELLYARKANVRGRRSIIFRLSHVAQQHLLQAEKIFVQWECLKVYEPIQVTICFKCQAMLNLVDLAISKSVDILLITEPYINKHNSPPSLNGYKSYSSIYNTAKIRSVIYVANKNHLTDVIFSSSFSDSDASVIDLLIANTSITIINQFLRLGFEREVEIVAYADDFTLIINGTSHQELEGAAGSAMVAAAEWARKFSLVISSEKSKYMIVKKGKPLEDINISLNGELISREQSLLLLGLRIDERLSWKPHWRDVRSKVVKKTLLLKSLPRTIIPIGLKITYYKSVIEPIILYGTGVIGMNGMSKWTCNMIRSIQQVALLGVTQAYRTTSTASLLCLCRLLPLDLVIKHAKIKKTSWKDVGFPSYKWFHPSTHLSLRNHELSTFDKKYVIFLLPPDLNSRTAQLRITTPNRVHWVGLSANRDSDAKLFLIKIIGWVIKDMLDSPDQLIQVKTCALFREVFNWNRCKITSRLVKLHSHFNSLSDRLVNWKILSKSYNSFKSKYGFDELPIPSKKHWQLGDNVSALNRKSADNAQLEWLQALASTNAWHHGYGFIKEPADCYKFLQSNTPNRAVIIFVSGHGPFKSYLHRFRLAQALNCPCGAELQDAQHVLFHCPQLHAVRQNFLNGTDLKQCWSSLLQSNQRLLFEHVNSMLQEFIKWKRLLDLNQSD
ncbi:Retrovirus-related Pol polyprotein from type-1 retrotransposable element R1 [Halotydeus destructor]|nr:Retrovirus-related Pol polyprotein from type-1 retrotransposable element R1 [Halotydeus destructor]